jgi:hypothetical protein
VSGFCRVEELHSDCGYGEREREREGERARERGRERERERERGRFIRKRYSDSSPANIDTQ